MSKVKKNRRAAAEPTIAKDVAAASASDRIVETMRFARLHVINHLGSYLPNAITDLIATNAALWLADVTNDHRQKVIVDKLRFAAREHELLIEVATKCARKELPVAFVAEEQLSRMVEDCVAGAVEERANVLESVFPSLYLSVFQDVLWPAIKLRLAHELGVTVSIDDSAFQKWLERD